MSEGYPQPPSPTAYHTMVAMFANAEGVALDVIDPTGQLEATVMTMIADLENDELGPFKFAVLEVMRQRNLDMQDLILTDNDLGSAEYGVALALWTEVNTRYNLGLSDGEMELLARESVATALMLHAADDELVETLVIDPEPPDIDNINTDDLWNDLHEISMGFDGIGICLEADASGGPALAGGVGTCIVSTDDDLGQIAWHAVGGAVGTSGDQRRRRADQHERVQTSDSSRVGRCASPAVEDPGVGASGTVCGGLDFHPDGTVPVQRHRQRPGKHHGDVAGRRRPVVLVRTYVVWRNGTLNVIREPFEAVGEHASGIFDQIERGFEQLVRPPRFSTD